MRKRELTKKERELELYHYGLLVHKKLGLHKGQTNAVDLSILIYKRKVNEFMHKLISIVADSELELPLEVEHIFANVLVKKYPLTYMEPFVRGVAGEEFI